MEDIPMPPLPPITEADIRRCLAKPSGPARGADHWTRAEIKALPTDALSCLGRFLGAAEESGRMPEVLRE
eukprot:12775549-Alexandrium_andersonii.AAC.1